MPVRSPAQCRRTVPRNAPAFLAGVWITDSMLRQAVEHYSRRTKAPCRHISSHSGPLESRRRLGKRQITGVMPSSPSYRPLWHFELASIPNEWKWEPPTTPEERQRKKHDFSVSGMFNNFIGWLEKADNNKPFLQPPSPESAPIPHTAAMEAAVTSDIREEDVTDMAVPQQDASTAVNIPTEIRTLRAKIALLSEVNEETLNAVVKNCRRSLRRRMELGYFTVEKLLHALDPLDAGTRESIADPQMAERLAAKIRRTVLSCLDMAQRRDSSESIAHLWMALADKILSSGVSNHNIQLFRRLIYVMPDTLKDQLSSDQIFSMARLFVHVQASKRNVPSHWSIRTARFVDALEKLNPAQRQNLENAMTEYLQGDKSPQTSSKEQSAWLLARSYDTNLSNQEFIAYYNGFVQVHGKNANTLQLWQLMIGRLKSAEAIGRDVYSELIRGDYRNFAQRWISLILRLQAIPNHSAALKELCTLLQRIGEIETVIATLTLPPIDRNSLDAAKTLAIASDDHRIALRIHRALEEQLGEEASLDGWDWTTWKPYVERIIKDPEIAKPVIWHVLNLSPQNVQHRKDPSADFQEIDAKLSLLNQMCQWYMEAPHLNERQIFRRIERCIFTQRELARTISSKVLANLADFVTQDLSQGKWGRTTRLEWLLKTIAKTQGEGPAGDARAALRGWRSMLDRNRGRYSG